MGAFSVNEKISAIIRWSKPHHTTTFTAEHCTMLMPYAAELGLSHHEILNLEGKASIVRGPFDLIYLDACRFKIHYQTIPEFFEGPHDLTTSFRLLREFLPIP